MGFKIVLYLIFVTSCAICASQEYESKDFEFQYYPVSRREERSFMDFISHQIDDILDLAETASIALHDFRNEVLKQVGMALAKVEGALVLLNKQVTEAIAAVVKKIPGVKPVKDCMAKQKEEADTIFNNAINKAQGCIKNRLQKASELYDSMTGFTAESKNYKAKTKEGARNCTGTGKFLKCIAKLAVKSAGFAAKSGYRLSRLHLHLRLLPARLGFCASIGLTNTATSTASVVYKISQCTAAKIYGRPTTERYSIPHIEYVTPIKLVEMTTSAAVTIASPSDDGQPIEDISLASSSDDPLHDEASPSHDGQLIEDIASAAASSIDDPIHLQERIMY